MFEVMEVSLGDTRRIYQYKQNCPLEIDFNIKGFDYAWVLASHAWKKDEKILDVGGAYSSLPTFIQSTYGCETWVADDFGITADDTFWTRNSSPRDYITSHPEITYKLERVGDPAHSSLPLNYFDVVYSASVLEHVPAAFVPNVWKHMAELVKPGGELIHAVDVPFPSNGGLSKVYEALIYDAFSGLLPSSFKVKHFLSTPLNYTRLVFGFLGIHAEIKNIGVTRMILDPEVVTEATRYGYNRIIKDGMKDFHFQRVGTLLLHFKKA